MHINKIFIILISVIFLQQSSFAFGMKDTMDKIMNSWIGENIDTVINHWGYPTDEKQIAGKHLYSWINNSYGIVGNQYGIYGGEDFCNRTFEVDKDNNVIKWQWDGNNCPITVYGGKKLVNPDKNPWQK